MAGDGSLPEALLVHGHLDVVPAEPEGWRHHPFSGHLDDGCLWGRGAVDMKGMIAMTLAVVRRLARIGKRPRRDVVLAFFADEECGARLGSGFVVRRHRDLFDGVTAAIGELGGFSVSVTPTVRFYPVQVAEKGARAVRVYAKGHAGHASMPRQDNAVVALARAVARAGTATLPVHMTSTTKALLREAGNALGLRLDAVGDPASLAALGQLRAWVEPTLRNTITPTILRTGGKGNVIPNIAEATLDCRFVPGGEDALTNALNELLGPTVEWEPLIEGPAVEAPWDHPLPNMMAAALGAEDPIARAVPFMIPAATDAKNLSQLGIACYGFAR